jgi:hypothetical protein
MMWNRVWLALTGLIMLVAGGAAMAGSLGAFGRETVLTGAMSQWAGHRPWFWPAVAAGTCAVAVLGSGWLTAQWRSRTLRRLAMGDPRSGATRIAARVATRAITADVRSYPGVREVRTRLAGSARRPRIRVRVTYEPGADLTELMARIRDDAMVRLRTTLDRADLGGVVDFQLSRADRPGGRRVG